MRAEKRGVHCADGSAAHPKFKDNPFFEVLDPVSTLVTLPVISTNRSTVNMTVKLAEEVCHKLRNDSNIRVCLFGAGDPIMGPHGLNDISFPHQMDVRINSEEFRANFKGLKNKPGSTRPADITSFLRRQATYSNSVQITYALTSRKFQVIAMLIRKRTIESLVEQIRHHRVITKERVLVEMRTKASDPDIVATSHVMTLKDPLSMSRIQLACRSTVCMHNQCFDAASFLQLQEQAPTWNCPICNKVTDFNGIVVDQ
jgi:E3 SUMO-protein ligase PIAS1